MIGLLLFVGLQTDVFVDRIEINTVYRCHCDEFTGTAEWRLQFTQLIFWRWSRRHGYVVAQWEMCDPSKMHIFSDRIWHNGKCVRAHCVQRTHTSYDPEVDNRELISIDRRKAYY